VRFWAESDARFRRQRGQLRELAQSSAGSACVEKPDPTPPVEASTPDRLSAAPVPPDPTNRSPGVNLRSALGAVCAVLALVALAWLTLARPGQAAPLVFLIGTFFISVVGAIAFLGPVITQLRNARSLTAGVASALGATGLLLALLQVLPDDSPTVSDPESSPGVTAGSTTSTAPAEGSASSELAGLYEHCLQQVKAQAKLRGDRAPAEDARGRVGIQEVAGTTVVVADQDRTWTCNLEPEFAVSYPGKAIIDLAGPSDFALAQYSAPGQATFFWGGGALPAGGKTISFIFPDKQEVFAETQDGFWVMQYFPRNEFDSRGPGIQVHITSHNTASGGGFELKWGQHTCNQVSHGC
jgi:hypothetical protein